MKFNSKYKIQIILMVFSFCTAVYSLYLTMHLSQIGFNGEKIGLIYGGISITGMLSQPIYLLINKKCKNNRLTLFISLFFASFAIISLVFLKSFTTILIVTSIICFFTVSLVSILDGMAVTYCIDNKIKYSSMKLWSSVGYALGSILLGGIYVKFGFSINLLVCGAGYMAIIILIKSTPKDIWLSENDLGINKEKVISKSFLSYLPFIVLVYGMNVVGCNNYGLLFPYLNFPDEIIGFSSFVSLLGEILTIIIIGKYVSKRNHTKLMILGTGLVSLRWLSYGFLPLSEISLYLIMFVFNGIGFGICHSMVYNVLKDVIKGADITGAIYVQNIAIAIFAAIVSVFIGRVVDGSGVVVAYRVIGGVSLVGVLYLMKGNWKVGEL